MWGGLAQDPAALKSSKLNADQASAKLANVDALLFSAVQTTINGGLAHRFAARSGAIWRALQLAAGRVATCYSASLEEAVLVAQLQAAVAYTSELGAFWTRVESQHTWDDLVLPAAAREQASLLLARHRATTRVRDEWGYGAKLAPANGTVVLLSGAPGVSKTLSAGVLSNERGLSLFAVDLSRVVSKWIGETETNLGKLFAAAEAEGSPCCSMKRTRCLASARRCARHRTVMPTWK